MSGERGRLGRTGLLAVELVMVLPLLLIVLLGMVEFSLLLTARQELLTASREGARVASHGGGDREAVRQEVEATVRRVLGRGQLGKARVEILWDTADPREPGNGRDRVRVGLEIGAAEIVPDLLGWAGLSIASDHLAAATLLNVE